MKRRTILLLALTLSLGLLGGCVFDAPLDPDQPIVVDVAVFKVISVAGAIYRPLVTGSDDWHVQPGNFETLDFSSGRDQYGNHIGLSNDDRWIIRTLNVRCDQKYQDDTLFWPSATQPVPYRDNDCVWFPGYTAPIETISRLPFPLYAISDYPWNPCQTNSVPVMSSQMATIIASARAEWVEIEITAPKRLGGEYALDAPGYTPTASNVLTTHLGSPQEITITWTKGSVVETWTIEVPVDWFWINGRWRIPVGPTGTCS